MIPFFEVHSFTKNIFHGNPAGVCPLDRWIDDDSMQRIASENSLSET
ncbi:MAG: PhzF family phenazine biosynthesis protein, partial [Acidobacteria bacterium]|nr:PhzF family phenazine biosynthesis protein [Candidatus Sulfomarinibacter sp. MAG AM2]